MKITTTLNNKHYESPLTREQLIALLDTDKTLDICFQEKQVYDRMQVLRGEYDPPLKSDYFNIIPNRSDIFKGHCYYRVTEDIPKGYRFFPTRELAEEFLLIEKGEWLPKEGDRIFYLDASPGVDTENVYCHFDFSSNMGRTKCFPSSAQRQAYIDKNKKPALPTVENLNEWWGNCEREEFSPAWEAILSIAKMPKPYKGIGGGAVKKSWLRSALKSKYIATIIRKAERETGEKWHVFGSFAGIDSVIKTASPELPIYGVEYFATEDGAELYRDAMGESIKDLLTK